MTGTSATVGELRKRWAETTVAENPTEFARFVARRAVLALERVEYRLLGPEYKSPRLVKPEILASARFRAGLETIPGATVEKAGKILDEMATGWSRLSVDLLPAWYRQVLKRGFDPNIDYSEAEIDVMRAAMESHPAVLLFSHRSNLDGVVLPVALQAHKLPRAHTFGGINMAMPGIGAILRRSGVIFIRRDIGDDPLYKYVLKQYVGYLAEKRFNLMWSIEVAWRIQQATPVNANALVSALLLASRGVALTLGQIHHTLQDGLDYLERKKTPMTDSAVRLRSADGVRAALDALSNGHPVTRIDGGWEPVWRIAPEHEHVGAFYRNSIVHAFLETCIVELALAHTARAEDNPVAAFWRQAIRLRDLLKFDFYFADSTAFRAHIANELSWQPDWEGHLDDIDTLLYAKRPLSSFAMLRPFFEGYEILADVLRNTRHDISEKELTKLALGVGKQYVAQGRVLSSESVSTLLFATAGKVAADQGLLTPGPDLQARRTAFHAELSAILSDINHIDSAARRQFVTREKDYRRTARGPTAW